MLGMYTCHWDVVFRADDHPYLGRSLALIEQEEQ